MTSVSVFDNGFQESDLIDHTSDWGISVSEATARKTLAMKCLSVAGYTVFAFASLWIIPILAGTFFFTPNNAVYYDAGLVGACVALAIFFSVQSRKGQKNALQIDYAAEEVRLGSITSAGAFVRHKVCSFRSIEDVIVDTSQPDAPGICLKMNGQQATLRFNQASMEHTTDLAGKIAGAVQAARSAPIRSRIQSRINGFEAGVREVGNRVRSRVQSSFA